MAELVKHDSAGFGIEFFEGAQNDIWDKFDPYLVIALNLAAYKAFREFFLLTGVRLDEQGVPLPNQKLPLLLELDKPLDKSAIDKLRSFGWEVPEPYDREVDAGGNNNKNLKRIAAHFPFDSSARPRAAFTSLFKALAEPNIIRGNIPGMYQAFKSHDLGESMPDIGLPLDRQFTDSAGKTHDLSGEDVIVGVIDDGCAFAHQKFLLRKNGGGGAKYKSRVLYLWDQTPLAQAPSSAWQRPNGFSYGYELTGKEIGKVVNKHSTSKGVVDENKVYDELNYKIEETASHGTHVMDIAAGNDRSLIGAEGVAYKADIVFVQLPRDLIEQGGPSLFDKILHGALYVFDRAAHEGKRAVVNISYGAFAGPHDGTSLQELGLDDLLAVPNRSVVVAAGNGFEADCHATESLQPGQRGTPLRWIVKPEDATLNIMDIWYDGRGKLDLYLTLPFESVPRGPISPSTFLPITQGSQVVGWVFHNEDELGNHDNHIVIALMPTVLENAGQPQVGSAPSGTWKLEFKNVGQVATSFDAWIERDAGNPGGARRRQSKFESADAYPGGTLSNLASGEKVISVGGYNAATKEVCRYSASGPTRPIRGDLSTIRRNKPEICAPAESDSAGRGILSASSLSAQPSRMNGTSAAAPHVAGLVALMLQVARRRRKSLTAEQIRDMVIAGAQAASTGPNYQPLKPNRHQTADDKRSIKQRDVWSDLTGAGRIDVIETVKKI